MVSVTNDKWERLNLVKTLLQNEDGRTEWENIRAIILYLEQLPTPRGYERYTDHRITHCYRILEKIDALISNYTALNGVEISVFILAVLFHDLGMWVREDELEAIAHDQNFLKFCYEHWPERIQLIEKKIASKDSKEKEIAFDLMWKPVAEWRRTFHAEYIHNILTVSGAQYGLIPQLINEETSRMVGELAAAHAWEIDQIDSSEKLRRVVLTTQCGNSNKVNTRFIAMLLRIGDLLDLDNRRAAGLVKSFLHLDQVNKSHWQVAETLRFTECETGIVSIFGDFSKSKDELTAARAHHLATSWIGWLKQDIDYFNQICAFPNAHDIDDRVKDIYWKLQYDLKAPLSIRGAYNGLRFNHIKLVELIGHSVYSNGYVFIRELLHNALDSIRLKMVNDYLSPNKLISEKVNLRTPSFWPSAIAQRTEYALHINCNYDVNDTLEVLPDLLSSSFDTFEIIDYGLGMTEDEIIRYLLCIGSSYHDSRNYTDQKIDIIGRFGVGLLSCIYAARKIEIITHSRLEANAYKVIILRNEENIESFLFHATLSERAILDNEFGTRVKLWLDPSEERAKYWKKNVIEGLTIDTAHPMEDAVKTYLVSLNSRLIINGEDIFIGGDDQERGVRAKASVRDLDFEYCRIELFSDSSSIPFPVELLSAILDHNTYKKVGFMGALVGSHIRTNQKRKLFIDIAANDIIDLRVDKYFTGTTQIARLFSHVSVRLATMCEQQAVDEFWRYIFNYAKELSLGRLSGAPYGELEKSLPWGFWYNDEFQLDSRPVSKILDEDILFTSTFKAREVSQVTDTKVYALHNVNVGELVRKFSEGSVGSRKNLYAYRAHDNVRFCGLARNPRNDLRLISAPYIILGPNIFGDPDNTGTYEYMYKRHEIDELKLRATVIWSVEDQFQPTHYSSWRRLFVEYGDPDIGEFGQTSDVHLNIPLEYVCLR